MSSLATTATTTEVVATVTAPLEPYLVLQLQIQPAVEEANANSNSITASSDPPRVVKWSGDTIDNEKLKRKSSKRCCIYHKPKRFGESDSEETSSDSDNGGDNSAAGGAGAAGGQGGNIHVAASKKNKVQPHLRFHA